MRDREREHVCMLGRARGALSRRVLVLVVVTGVTSVCPCVSMRCVQAGVGDTREKGVTEVT